MAKAVQAQPEPDYGAKVDQANAEDAIAATAPAPGVPPLETEEGAGVVPEAPVVASAQQAPTRQPYTVKNPYMLLPSGVNFQQPGKTPTEQNYEVGMLFEVLGRNDPVMRRISQELMGK